MSIALRNKHMFALIVLALLTLVVLTFVILTAVVHIDVLHTIGAMYPHA